MFWLEVQDYLKKMSSQVVCQSIRDKPLSASLSVGRREAHGDD